MMDEDPFKSYVPPAPPPPISLPLAPVKPKPKRVRTASRKNELEKRKVKKAILKFAATSAPPPVLAAPVAESDPAAPAAPAVPGEEVVLRAQLAVLEQRSKDMPTDADRDIDFAYRHMDSQVVTPLMAPTTSAWSWLTYARTERNKFLEICAKREDAKAKLAGTVTSQRIEDDKRHQFAILDRIEQQLKLDIKTVIKDLMTKFPEDTLLECRKYEAAWRSFHEKHG